MSAKVLCVDDDAKILNGIRRQLGDRFELDTAEGPLAAQQLLKTAGPYAVVVSDMRMPEMSGLELLTRIRKETPDTVRIMLTGHADLKTMIDAVNEGHIFRFQTKPCSADVLAGAISDGLRQYQLVTAERELVEGTLKGSVKVLSEMLSLVSPLAFGRASRVQRTVTRVAARLSATNIWEFEIAAMLSQLGCAAIPETIVHKVSCGETLSPSELEIYRKHPQLACKLISNIPRLEAVAEAVRYQAQAFDGTGFPGNGVKAHDLPLGARILKAVLDLDTAMMQHSDAILALRSLKQESHKYDPDVLIALEPIVAEECEVTVFSVEIYELEAGMVFAEDVLNSQGQTLIAKGQEVTETLRTRLVNLSSKVRGPLTVSLLRKERCETQMQRV